MPDENEDAVITTTHQEPFEVELQIVDFNHGLSSAVVASSLFKLPRNFKPEPETSQQAEAAIDGHVLDQGKAPPSLFSVKVETPSPEFINKNQNQYAANSNLFPMLDGSGSAR